jgi:beta-xylosidase
VVPNLYLAPNTLTQRMEGPKCTGSVALDLSKMKDGDIAGLAAFNDNSAVMAIKKVGKKLTLELSEHKVKLSQREKKVENVDIKVVESVELKQQKIWLRIDANFVPRTDIANFSYSLDGKEWTKIGGDYRMGFDWQRFFMGTKFGIFNYATKKAGGYVDVDEFSYNKHQ